jgi:hypothetical protein
LFGVIVLCQRFRIDIMMSMSLRMHVSKIFCAPQFGAISKGQYASPAAEMQHISVLFLTDRLTG